MRLNDYRKEHLLSYYQFHPIPGAQWFRALAAPAGDLASDPSIHMAAHSWL